MAKIILKSPYLKPNAKVHIENYIRYIATRDGAEPAKNSTNTIPAFKTQKKLVDKLVKIYPDSKELFEYEDYLSHPTRENADELIMRIAEMHSELFGDREKYVKYIAERPRVEVISSHGLFTDEGVPIILSDVAKEAAESESNIWTHIISLRREDAERLGYNCANEWMNLIRANRNMIARNMKIAPENFRWYAAFHNESHHPHVHMIAEISNNKEHLSYGERNAFALALFMYNALNEDVDLVILDDPISSFDGNKKFAIINKLFMGSNSLKDKTVLLLTHEFNII